LRRQDTGNKRNRKTYTALSFACAILLVIPILLALIGNSSGTNPANDSGIKTMDAGSLRKEIRLLEQKVRRLTEKRDGLYPSGISILVDSARNQVYLLKGVKVVLQDKCSTGNGFELTDTHGQRSWTFETPRGYFRVRGKVANPVWFRPDWAFIEEGESIPKDRASRAMPDVLGKYAIAFGDGYFIHGTLYTRMLGNSVTHGCVRVDDDALRKIYDYSQSGTPIWIY
jgi:L,D-transpeptidase ErfK/SrfK